MMQIFDSSNQVQTLFTQNIQKVHKVSPVKSKKKNKLDYVAQMQKAPITPFICKNHEGVHLKIRQQKTPALCCNSCGTKCQGKSGFISCPKSSTCVNLCSVCRVCPKNHPLRNCISLIQFQQKNVLYVQNKFQCMGCDSQQKVSHEGVLHCPTCNFSICMNCIKKLNQIWQKLADQDPQNPQ